MLRPCFIVIDREYPDSISTRKLVLETAKYNVITAYGGREAIETLKSFPNVSGIVLNDDVADMDVDTLVGGLRTLRPDVLLILTSSRLLDPSVSAYHQVNSFDPGALLALLRKLVPNPYEQTIS